MNGARGRGVSNGTGADDTVASRAALFEDEKRRIIESCFTKREPDGTFAESYITHIRVTEDATSPSTPPPPDSAPDNKKSRAIIVAVKRSGRVRLHKARENPQGTFSIGKTWVLDDLSAIESYTGLLPTTEEEYRMKEWAGDTGVLLTIQKPYFWQIATQKEKDFFVGSLIKIYRKYTKGREPRLSGFTNKELSDFGVQGQPPPLNAAQRSPAPAEPSPYVSPSPAPSPFNERSRARDLRPPSSDSNAGLHTGSTYIRSPSSTSRGDEAPPRFQNLRSGSNVSSALGEARSDTPRDGSFVSKGFESSRESLPHDIHGSSTSNDRTKANGGFPTFPRSREPLSHGRPLDSPRRTPSSDQGFTTRPKTPERRSGMAVRKASGSEDSKDGLPERRRPPLMTSPEPPAVIAPEEPVPKPILPTINTERALDPVVEAKSIDPPVVDPPKAKEPDTSHIPPTGGDSTSDHPANLNISQALSITSPTDSLESSLASPEEHRPGLGPMIRKKKSAKEIANTFRKAANAANAFKPRAGGAAERLMRDQSQGSPDDRGDGVTGVFVGRAKEPATKPVEPPTAAKPAITTATSTQPISDSKLMTPAPEAKEDSRPQTPQPPTIAEPKRISNNLTTQPLSIPKPAEKLTEEIKALPEKKKPLPDRSAHYAKIFGVDPALFDGRTIAIDAVLDDYGWSNGADGQVRKTVEELQTDIKRDHAKLETGSWLSVMENNDDRIKDLNKWFDIAQAECDELDGLLTLYNVELSTLREDVAFIEAQSQGLQVQTANQRLLQTELQNLLETITIPEEKLIILERSSHESQNSLSEIGDALVHLYKAMITIDPSIRQSRDKEITNGLSADVSNMRAVRDQKDKYTRASVAFVQTFNNKMVSRFRSGQKSVRDVIASQRSQPLPGTKIDHAIRDKFRTELLHYSPIMLFAREVRQEEHQSLLAMYADTAVDPYKEQFRAVTLAWQRDTKMTTGSEDVLFTTQEKEPEGGMARKLTVKRSKTVMKAEVPKGLGIERDQSGKIEPYVAFNGALIDLSQAVMFEQNFVTEFFHLHSGQNADFPELVERASSGIQVHTNLLEPRGYESDRDMAKIIKMAIAQMFPDWERTLRTTIDQIINEDVLNAFGILFSVQHRANVLIGTSQEFLLSSLSQVEEYLDKRIKDMVKDQIKAIDDQKVKLKKRKGVLSFIRIFPLFVKAIEVQLPGQEANQLRIRKTIDDHYATINTHIFQSLKAIAKDSGISGMGNHKPHGLQGAVEAEDKEILNYHILLIENTHHYLEDVPEGTNYALDAGRETAKKEFDEHMDLYISAILRRPLGKLLDFVESTEGLMKAANDGPASIANRASHSKSVFKRILSSHDSKEVVKGIEALKKRVNKHYAEADEAVISQTLIAKVLRECSERYLNLYDRTSAVIKDVYEGGLEIEFKRDDVHSAFRRV